MKDKEKEENGLEVLEVYEPIVWIAIGCATIIMTVSVVAVVIVLIGVI